MKYELNGLPQNRRGSPFEELGLPNNTGLPIPSDPTDNIISTPIPEEAGPNIVASDRTPEELGVLASDPARSGIIDKKGQAWDVKGFRSNFPASSGGFDVDEDIAKVERELAAGHNVIIDTANPSEADLEALRNEIERRGLSDRVVYWP